MLLFKCQKSNMSWDSLWRTEPGFQGLSGSDRNKAFAPLVFLEEMSCDGQPESTPALGFGHFLQSPSSVRLCPSVSSERLFFLASPSEGSCAVFELSYIVKEESRGTTPALLLDDAAKCANPFELSFLSS